MTSICGMHGQGAPLDVGARRALYHGLDAAFVRLPAARIYHTELKTDLVAVYRGVLTGFPAERTTTNERYRAIPMGHRTSDGLTAVRHSRAGCCSRLGRPRTVAITGLGRSDGGSDSRRHSIGAQTTQRAGPGVCRARWILNSVHQPAQIDRLTGPNCCAATSGGQLGMSSPKAGFRLSPSCAHTGSGTSRPRREFVPGQGQK